MKLGLKWADSDMLVFNVKIGPGHFTLGKAPINIEHGPQI